MNNKFELNIFDYNYIRIEKKLITKYLLMKNIIKFKYVLIINT